MTGGGCLSGPLMSELLRLLQLSVTDLPCESAALKTGFDFLPCSDVTGFEGWV